MTQVTHHKARLKSNSEKKGGSQLPKTRQIPANHLYPALIERQRMKHASIQFRNDMLKANARAHYHNEYDRIRSILTHTVVPQGHMSRERLENRAKELKRLAMESVHPPHHEIYNT